MKIKTPPWAWIRGKFGDRVYRKTRYGTIVSKLPKYKDNPTEKQKTQRELFRMAAAFAKEKMKDPIAKQAYWDIARRENMVNPYAAAVADFFRSRILNPPS
jgi:hypothetical protein